MIKFKKENHIILGLSEENINRLKNNQPISFNLKELGLEDRQVLIFYGKTEADMFLKLEPFIDINKTEFK